MSRACSWALLAGGALDGAGELDGVVFGLRAHGLEEDALGVVGAHPGDALERDDLLLGRLGEIVLGPVEVALALQQLAVALLQHLRALIQLLVALDQASLLGGQLAAARSRLVLGFPGQSKLLVLGLEDQFLLAGAGLGLDADGLPLGGLHRLGCPDASDQEPE